MSRAISPYISLYLHISPYISLAATGAGALHVEVLELDGWTHLYYPLPPHRSAPPQTVHQAGGSPGLFSPGSPSLCV